MLPARHSPPPPLLLSMLQHPFLLLLLILLLGLQAANSFNLEPESSRNFTDPTPEWSSWGRGSYFGFSVALQRRYGDGSAWLLVGAPRANSSQYDPSSTNITEPGAVFKCQVDSDPPTCEELLLDQTGDETYEGDDNYYKDSKSWGWLGAAMDSQPVYDQGRQTTAVCAPKWINQALEETSMNGACYWMNASLPNAPAHKKLPLLDYSKQTKRPDGGDDLFYFKYGEAGISVHFPDEATEMIIGAPGIFNWQGSVIRLMDDIKFHRRRRQANLADSESQMFSNEFVFNPHKTGDIDKFSLNGYAVTSGHFFKNNELLYVSGAPRAASSYGKVFIFEFPDNEDGELTIKALLKGTQQGESFGASLVSADINGDGLSDLVVGCPTFFRDSKADIGRIQVFLGKQDGTTVELKSTHDGSKSPSAKFGTTLVRLADLNHDNYEDVAVGAPWENDGKGAVYIYLGSRNGLRKYFSQRLSPENFPALNLHGFGMGISRGIDIDDNGYPDVGIGSFLSGPVIVLQSRTVASIKGKLKFEPPALKDETTNFELQACIEYSGYNVPAEIEVGGIISLDEEFTYPRASFRNDSRNFRNITINSPRDTSECHTFDVDVKSDKLDPLRPIIVRFDHWLVDVPGRRMSLPAIDPHESRSNLFPIGVVSECKDDGNPICNTNMSIKASFVNYGKEERFPIGSKDQPVLEVTVMNSGEPVYLSNITVQVPKPLGLFMPDSHKCIFPVKGNRSSLICYLKNPIKRGAEDRVRVTVDASDAKDTTANELEVTVVAEGEGEDLQPSDDSASQKLYLMAKAELELRSFSQGDRLFYQTTEDDKINITRDTLSFTHFHVVAKTGPTPLGRVDLVVDIPVNFTRSVNFITLYNPRTNFKNIPFNCTVEGTTLTIDNTRSANNDTPTVLTNDTLLFDNTSMDSRTSRAPGFIGNVITSGNQSLHEKVEFVCPSNQVACAKFQCQIYSWPVGSHTAEFSVKMDVSFTELAHHISALHGTSVSSKATVSITSISEDLPFQGNMNISNSAKTDILPTSLEAPGIPWWIILLAILGSLILLALLVFGLYKMGFFHRKEREEMEAYRARVVPSETEGAAE